MIGLKALESKTTDEAATRLQEFCYFIQVQIMTRGIFEALQYFPS